MSSIAGNRFYGSVWSPKSGSLDLSRPNCFFKFRLSDQIGQEYVSGISIILVGKGILSLCLDHRNYQLSPRQFAIAKPGNAVKFTSTENDTEILIVTLESSHADEHSHLLEGSYPLDDTHLGIQLKDLFDRLSIGSQIKDQRLTELFLRELDAHQKRIREKIENIKSVKGSTREEVYRQILKVEVYIEDNLNAKIQLSDLCDVAGISRFHFLRKFQEANDLSPHQYILRRKVRKSCSLINQHQLTLSEIASQAGLGSIHNFSKVFKRIMGFPPSELRKTG